MATKQWINVAVLLFFIVLSAFIFRKYFFDNLIPFPSNLLVSFYSPWKYEEWEGYPNGPANKPIGFDVLKLFYPYRSYTTERLKEGEIPLWNPFVFSGNVHLATYQSAVFYPLNIVYFIVPLIDAWSLLVVLQPILAGFFMFLFLRSLSLRVKSSVWGGIIFAFSGWMIGWSEESLVIEHSALWLPLALYGIQLLFHKNYSKGFLFVVTAFSSSIFAGFLQMTLYVGCASVAWIVYRYASMAKKNKTALYYFLAASITSFLLSAVHLFPAFESYWLSPRGVVKAAFLFDTYLMRPWHLITMLVPDFWGNPGSYNYFDREGFYHEKLIFVGIPGLLAALYLFLKQSKTETPGGFFKWGFIVTLLLGFFPVGWILYHISLPVISAMVPSRIFFLSTFFLSVVSAVGMEEMLRGNIERKRVKNIVIMIASIFAVLWIFVLIMRAMDSESSYGTISLRNLVVPSAIYFICAFLLVGYSGGIVKKHILFFSFLILTVASSSYFAHKFLYFSERRFVFPEIPVIQEVRKRSGIARVWGYGNGYVEKNMLSFYGIYSPEGYDALYSQRYGELLYTQESSGKITDQISRTDATIRLASERDRLLDNRERSRLMSLLGVRYVLEGKRGEGKEWLTNEDRFPDARFSLVWEDGSFRIWEFKDALPRAFAVVHARTETDPQHIINYLFDSATDLRNSVVVEKNIQLEPCEAENTTQTTFERYEPELVRIATSNTCEALLFLSDSYYPGWYATVDGKESEIYRADYAFRAVRVPAGTHIVEFTYRPQSFTLGVWVTLIAPVAGWVLYTSIKKHAE